MIALKAFEPNNRVRILK